MFDRNNAKFKNFMTDYVDIISEKYDELEAKRYFFLKQLFYKSLPFLISILVGLIICIFAAPYSIIFFVAGIIPFIYAISYQKEYSQYLKNAVGYQLLSKYFNITPIDTTLDEIIIKSELFPKACHLCEVDDCFEGKYKNVNFKIYELKAGQGGRPGSHEHTLFRGFIFIFDQKGNLPNNIVISSKNIYVNIAIVLILIFLGLFFAATIYFSYLDKVQGFESSYSHWDIVEYLFYLSLFVLVYFLSKGKLSKVRLHSYKFMRHFDVKAEDKENAKKMITHEFMNLMLNFEYYFDGKHISCAVCEEKVIFAVESNKDLFELGSLFVPLKKSKAVYNFYNEINSIFRLINYFKLYNNTNKDNISE